MVGLHAYHDNSRLVGRARDPRKAPPQVVCADGSEKGTHVHTFETERVHYHTEYTSAAAAAPIATFTAVVMVVLDSAMVVTTPLAQRTSSFVRT